MREGDRDIGSVREGREGGGETERRRDGERGRGGEGERGRGEGEWGRGGEGSRGQGRGGEEERGEGESERKREIEQYVLVTCGSNNVSNCFHPLIRTVYDNDDYSINSVSTCKSLLWKNGPSRTLHGSLQGVSTGNATIVVTTGNKHGCNSSCKMYITVRSSLFIL